MHTVTWAATVLCLGAMTFSTRPTSAGEPVITSLFDGKSLGKWQVAERAEFARHGRVEVEQGRILLGEGKPATGIRWSGEVPRRDYQLSLETMRLKGNDFFCGLTFPVGDNPCTLILGGWGGKVVGLSNINGAAAAENETTTSRDFVNDRWYHVRLRVTGTEIRVWIDDEKVIDVPTADRKFSIWPQQEAMLPLGIATWRTQGAIRNLQLERLTSAPAK